jgi:hypothetical protein
MPALTGWHFYKYCYEFILYWYVLYWVTGATGAVSVLSMILESVSLNVPVLKLIIILMRLYCS